MKVKDLFRVCDNYFSYILVLDPKNKSEVLEEFQDDSEGFEDKYGSSTIVNFIIYDSNDAGDNGAVLEITLR